MELNTLVHIVYLLSALTFILGLKLMSNPESARHGNLISGTGMVAATIVTLMDMHIGRYDYILIGLVVGTAAGLRIASKTPSGAVPQTIGLFNAFGGLASLLVVWAEFYARPEGQGFGGGLVLWGTAVFGAVTFSGSVTVWAKLEKKLTGIEPAIPAGPRRLNLLLAGTIFAGGVLFSMDPVSPQAGLYFAVFVAPALALGIRLVLPFHAADMSIVLCLLNSCSGIAVCASGFIVGNNLLVIAGALVAAAGISLALQMCKAANRSIREFYPFP